ncbi:MAG: ATP-binding cassette domain-containing protein, partial [Planctomycetes bacterium]|nr:ATP-binding cassette domain-containing protein [Planctomycetota bacterium]
CGKSTLLALLGALERPTTGAVLHDGADLGGASESELSRVRRGVGFVFQSAPMIRGLPVWENVTQALVPRGVGPKERRAAAASVLDRLGVAFATDRRPEEISGGERQRVAFARAIVAGPRLLLADEPTSQLDPESAAAVVAAIRSVHADGCTVIVASHDPAVLAVAGEVHPMRNGRRVAR